METTIIWGHIGVLGYIEGLSRGNGKEDGNYYISGHVGIVGYIEMVQIIIWSNAP